MGKMFILNSAVEAESACPFDKLILLASRTSLSKRRRPYIRLHLYG